MSLKKALIVGDVHRPFHSRKAYSLMIEAATLVGIDEIVILGDYLDFYSVSRFCKDPRVSTLLMEEIESGREGLDELDRLFPQAKKVYLSGNHELRLETYLIERAPGLFGVTEVRNLLEIDRRVNWSYLEFGRSQQYAVLGSDLLAFHRPRASSPKQHIARTLVSSVYGDVHKIELAHAVGLDGQRYTCFCPGWLGDVQSRVFDYMPSTPQWQLGFAFVYLDSSGSFYPEICEIKNNQVVVQGKVIKC